MLKPAEGDIGRLGKGKRTPWTPETVFFVQAARLVQAPAISIFLFGVLFSRRHRVNVIRRSAIQQKEAQHVVARRNLREIIQLYAMRFNLYFMRHALFTLRDAALHSLIIAQRITL